PLLATYEPPAADLDRVGRIGLIAGGAAAVVTGALAFGDPLQFLRSYLVAFVWVFGAAMGCFGLMMLHHLSSGGLGLMVRRIFEAASRTIPLLAVAFVPIALGVRSIYPWAAPGVHTEGFRGHYLTINGFIIRAALSFVLWSLLALAFSRFSLEHDKVGGSAL